MFRYIFDIRINPGGLENGLDNASVMVTDFIAHGYSSRVRFSTLNMTGLADEFDNMSPLMRHLWADNTGNHVVTGDREWGFRVDESGQVYLYNAGISDNVEAYTAIGDVIMRQAQRLFGDSAAYDAGGMQNLMWFSWAESASNWVDRNGGVAGQRSYMNMNRWGYKPEMSAVPNIEF